jgi:hypothetical protein
MARCRGNVAVPFETSSSQVTDNIFDAENLASGSRSTSEVTVSEITCQNFPAEGVDA